MTDMKIRRPEANSIVQKQDWYVDMPKVLQDKLFAEAQIQLEVAGGWRVWPMGGVTRRKVAECFVDAAKRTTDEREARKIFRRNLKDEGYGSAIILLIISVVWQCLFYWWTHRETE